MRARALKLAQYLSDAFWVLPAGLALALAGLGALVVDLQRWGGFLTWLPDDWVYGGGETGARTLLGAVASSTIGVAGTLFSITIAALSLASNQMGPRLLRNFVRDRGNQLTLGVLLGTFAYSLVVLRSVRGGGDVTFVPALGVTIAMLLAAVCLGLMIYFIHHVATRINVDTVIDLVHDDIEHGLERLPADEAAASAAPALDWAAAGPVRLEGSGYLQQIDAAAIVAWAVKHDATVRLAVRRGDFVQHGAVVAHVLPPVEGAEAAIRGATALSAQAPGDDLIYSIMQLVEVAVRALSPGVNDPRTAQSVLNRLGAVLGSVAERRLPSGLHHHDGALRLITPEARYADLASAMFTMIRQSAGRSPVVLVHLLEVLRAVAEVERDEDRLAVLRRIGAETAAEGRIGIANPLDRDTFAAAYRAFQAAAARRTPQPAAAS